MKKKNYICDGKTYFSLETYEKKDYRTNFTLDLVMLTKVFSQSKFIEFSMLVLIVLLGAFCIYTPDILPLRWGANHAPQIMFFYFGLGIAFFLFKKPKFMFTSFACCASLCVFLKENTHGQQMQYAVPTNQPEIKVAHFNVSNFEPNIDFTLDYLENLDADILSIQGLDPEFSFLLEEYLLEEYPHQVLLPSLSFDGIAVLSKYRFTADTFYHEKMANILGEITVKGYEKFYFVASHTIPTLTTVDYEQTQAHLSTIAANCSNLDAPLVTFGDYHLVSWSPEIQIFRESVSLNDSRIGFMPSFIDGRVNFWDVPQDHIFYSDHFKCTSFSVLSSPNSPHMGITGTFELLEEGQSLSDASLYHPHVAQ